MMSIIYMEQLNDQENAAIVGKILDDFFAMDQGSDEDWKANIQKLQVIKDLGEDDVFDAVMEDLQDDPRYSKLIK